MQQDRIRDLESLDNKIVVGAGEMLDVCASHLKTHTEIYEATKARSAESAMVAVSTLYNALVVLAMKRSNEQLTREKE